MSIATSRLGLLKPTITDEVSQTIADLASNFQKLDDVAESYGTAPPTSGFWPIKARRWNESPSIGQPAGWINVRAGQASSAWSSLSNYYVGDVMVPTENNGHFYTCTQSGTSGPFEPSWNSSAGSITEDTKDKNNWQPSKLYKPNDVLTPSFANGFFYVCTVGGQSGLSEPLWSIVSGSSTIDNQAVWMAYRIVTWKESGTSCNFRPFGTIG